MSPAFDTSDIVPGFTPCPPQISLCACVCMQISLLFFFITFYFSIVYGPWDWKRSICLIAVRQGNGL